MPRKRRPETAAADEIWWYRMECWKRSPAYEQLQAKPGDASDSTLASLWKEFETAPVFPIASDGQTWVTLKVDLRLPPRSVLPRIEKHLRDLRNELPLGKRLPKDPHLSMDERIAAFKSRKIEALRNGPLRPYLEAIINHLRDHPPSPFVWVLQPKRFHTKDLKVRVRVWDLLKEHGDLAKVARSLKKPLSTVRDLYMRAALDICGNLPDRGRRVRAARLLHGFDPATHATTCPTCRAARREENFCPAWRAYLNQDWASPKRALTEYILDPQAVARHTADKLPSKPKVASTTE